MFKVSFNQWYCIVVADLCTTAGVRKVATELGKVKEMFERVYVLVEKDSGKKSDPSKFVLLTVMVDNTMVAIPVVELPFICCPLFISYNYHGNRCVSGFGNNFKSHM